MHLTTYSPANTPNQEAKGKKYIYIYTMIWKTRNTKGKCIMKVNI